MLSDAEIIRVLREVRHSSRSDRYARRAISINAIATSADLSRCHVHDIVAGRRPLGPISRHALSQAISCLQIDGAENGGRPAQDGSRGPDRG